MSNSFEYLDLKPTNTLYPLENVGEQQICNAGDARYLIVEDLGSDALLQRIVDITNELNKDDPSWVAALLLDSALQAIEWGDGIEEFKEKYEYALED